MIFLDTNVVIVAVNRRSPATRVRLMQALAAGTQVAISSVVWFELQYGIEKSETPARSTERLQGFMADTIEVQSFDVEDGKEAANIRASLERIGKPIGSHDILIAARARRRNAVLVTANTREFARVPGLRIEDWTIAP